MIGAVSSLTCRTYRRQSGDWLTLASRRLRGRQRNEQNTGTVGARSQPGYRAGGSVGVNSSRGQAQTATNGSSGSHPPAGRDRAEGEGGIRSRWLQAL